MSRVVGLLKKGLGLLVHATTLLCISGRHSNDSSCIRCTWLIGQWLWSVTDGAEGKAIYFSHENACTPLNIARLRFQSEVSYNTHFIDFFLMAHAVHAAADAVQMTRKTMATNPSMTMKRRILLSSSQLPIGGIAVLLSCGESRFNVNLKLTKLRFVVRSFTLSLGVGGISTD